MDLPGAQTLKILRVFLSSQFLLFWLASTRRSCCPCSSPGPWQQQMGSRQESGGRTQRSYRRLLLPPAHGGAASWHSLHELLLSLQCIVFPFTANCCVWLWLLVILIGAVFWMDKTCCQTGRKPSLRNLRFLQRRGCLAIQNKSGGGAAQGAMRPKIGL